MTLGTHDLQRTHNTIHCKNVRSGGRNLGIGNLPPKTWKCTFWTLFKKIKFSQNRCHQLRSTGLGFRMFLLSSVNLFDSFTAKRSYRFHYVCLLVCLSVMSFVCLLVTRFDWHEQKWHAHILLLVRLREFLKILEVALSFLDFTLFVRSCVRAFVH